MISQVKMLHDIIVPERSARTVQQLYHWFMRLDRDAIKGPPQKATKALQEFHDEFTTHGFGNSAHLSDIYNIYTKEKLFDDTGLYRLSPANCMIMWSGSRVLCNIPRQVDVASAESIFTVALYYFSAFNRSPFAIDTPITEMISLEHNNGQVKADTNTLLNLPDCELSLFTKYIPLTVLNYDQLLKFLRSKSYEMPEPQEPGDDEDGCIVCLGRLPQYPVLCVHGHSLCYTCRLKIDACPMCRSQYVV